MDFTNLITLLSDFWIVWTFFIIFMAIIMYALKRAIDMVPKAITSHFEQIEKASKEHSENIRLMQKDFTQALADITHENKIIADNFISKLWDDHIKQNVKLEAIHTDIKLLKK